MDKFPNKRDYGYSIIISSLIIIFLVISFVANPSKVNSELGLASTIASIILSVIAIIYTLVESASSKKSTEQIIDASEKIHDVTGKINNSTDTLNILVEQLTMLDIPTKICNLEELVKGVDENVITANRNFKDNLTQLTQSISSLNIEGKDVSTSISNKDKIEAIHFLIDRFNKSFHLQECVYLFYKLREIKNPIVPGMEIYSKLFVEEEDSALILDNKEFLMGQCYTIMGIFFTFGYAKLNDKELYFDFEDFKEIIDDIEMNNKEFVKKLNNELRNL